MATKTINQLFLAAIEQGDDARALQLLESGADPLFIGMTGLREECALECAVGNSRHDVADAIVARLTQEQKDQLLVDQVRKGHAGCVRPLLDAGANVMQQVDGHSLIELGPDGNETLKRMLRSHEAGALLASAMGGAEAPEAAPKSSFTL